MLIMMIDNANKIVYDKLATWLIKAFNREYLKQNEEPIPLEKEISDKEMRRRSIDEVKMRAVMPIA